MKTRLRARPSDCLSNVNLLPRKSLLTESLSYQVDRQRGDRGSASRIAIKMSNPRVKRMIVAGSGTASSALKVPPFLFRHCHHRAPEFKRYRVDESQVFSPL